MTRLIAITLFTALLGGCTIPTRDYIGEAQTDCARVGFTPGTDGYRYCVMQGATNKEAAEMQRSRDVSAAFGRAAAIYNTPYSNRYGVGLY
jgi:hypothetical protein